MTERDAGALITVLHCRSSSGTFGPERVIMELAPALRGRGVEPRLLALYRPQPSRPAEHPLLPAARAAGIDAQQVTDPGPLSVAVVRMVGQKVRDSRADILHTHDYRTNILGGVVARRADRAIPWVATVHLHTTTTRRLRLYRTLDLFLLRLADQVITVSRDQRRLLLRRGVDRRRLALIPPAVNAKAFADAAEDRAAARARLEVDDNAPLIVLVGRLTRQKGADVFLTAARTVHDSVPESRFLIVGNGPERSSLEALAGELGLAAVARIVGYRTDVASIIAASDIVVLPSRAEGLPVVLLEALSLAKPVVASCVGGIPDLVRHAETGLLVPANCPTRVAESVLSLLDSPGLARELGQAGRQHVRRHCSPDRAARRLASIYRAVLSERS